MTNNCVRYFQSGVILILKDRKSDDSLVSRYSAEYSFDPGREISSLEAATIACFLDIQLLKRDAVMIDPKPATSYVRSGDTLSAGGSFEPPWEVSSTARLVAGIKA